MPSNAEKPSLGLTLGALGAILFLPLPILIITTAWPEKITPQQPQPAESVGAWLATLEAMHPGLQKWVDAGNYEWGFGERWSYQILGIKDVFLHDTGAYDPYGLTVPINSQCTLLGPYVVPNCKLDSLVVYTNKIHGTAYRGFGHLEVLWGIERNMDMVARALKAKREERAEQIRDQAETLLYLAEGMKGVAELEKRIFDLFDDAAGTPVVVCSTVHRAKGLESNRVFILRDTLRPRFARGPNAKPVSNEERNIEYVAITRSKAELIWVDGEPN